MGRSARRRLAGRGLVRPRLVVRPAWEGPPEHFGHLAGCIVARRDSSGEARGSLSGGSRMLRPSGSPLRSGSRTVGPSRKRLRSGSRVVGPSGNPLRSVFVVHRRSAGRDRGPSAPRGASAPSPRRQEKQRAAKWDGPVPNVALTFDAAGEYTLRILQAGEGKPGGRLGRTVYLVPETEPPLPGAAW